MPQLIITWIEPNNGLAVCGPIVIQSNLPFKHIVDIDSRYLHQAIPRALDGTAIAGLDFDTMDFDDTEYDLVGNEGSVQVLTIAYETAMVTFTYVPKID